MCKSSRVAVMIRHVSRTDQVDGRQERASAVRKAVLRLMVSSCMLLDASQEKANLDRFAVDPQLGNPSRHIPRPRPDPPALLAKEGQIHDCPSFDTRRSFATFLFEGRTTAPSQSFRKSCPSLC